MNKDAYTKGNRDGQAAWDTLIVKAPRADRETLVGDYVRGVLDTLDDNLFEDE